LIFTHATYPGGFWFRLFGRGLSVSDKIKNPPLFSERYGYRKILRFGKWGIEYLRPATKIEIDASWDTTEADPIADLYRACIATSTEGSEYRQHWESKLEERTKETKP